jgi:hypothetical protein
VFAIPWWTENLACIDAGFRDAVDADSAAIQRK